MCLRGCQYLLIVSFINTISCLFCVKVSSLIFNMIVIYYHSFVSFEGAILFTSVLLTPIGEH